jgi:hypothetical protein
MTEPPAEPMYQGAVQPFTGYSPPYWGQLPPRPALRNELGSAALALGICGAVLFWLPTVGLALGISAIATGAAGWKRIKRGQANNKGAAITGIVLGTVASILGILIVAGFLYLIISYQNCIDHAQGRGEYARC